MKLPERTKEIKAAVTLENPWPFEITIGGVAHVINEVTLRCPTILDIQVLHKKKTDGKEYDAALIARLGNLPEKTLWDDGFKDPFRAELIHAFGDFFDEAHIHQIQTDARESRKDVAGHFDYTLRVPIAFRGEHVSTVRVNPPPISAYKHAGDLAEFAMWAPAFLARILTWEKAPGEWIALDGSTCQNLSVQDANELLGVLDFFSRVDLLAPLDTEVGVFADR